MKDEIFVEPKLMTDAIKDKMHGAEKYYDVYASMEDEETVYLLENVKTEQSIPVYDHKELSDMCKFLMHRCKARKRKK